MCSTMVSTTREEREIGRVGTSTRTRPRYRSESNRVNRTEPSGSWHVRPSPQQRGHLDSQGRIRTRRGRVNLHAGGWREMDVGSGWQWDAIRGGGQCRGAHRAGWTRWDLGPGAVCLRDIGAWTRGGFEGGAGEGAEGPMGNLRAHMRMV